MRRLLIALVVLPGLLLTAQTGLFLAVLLDDETLSNADLIAVFAGGPGRIQAAYNLIDLSYARNLVISPATEAMLDRYERIHRPSAAFTRILETEARTTLENAFYTAELAARHEFKSVILVTSWNHLPRSFLLLRLLSFRSGLHLQTFGVPTGTIGLANWYRHGVGWKMVYNEMVECWGSLLEVAQYPFIGRLPERPSDPSAIITVLKGLLLFEIDERSLQ